MSQSYYGGEENPYEAIKVIEAWDLNFSLGSVLKYINRHGKKPGEDAVKDLKKCLDYIGYEIARIERERYRPELQKTAHLCEDEECDYRLIHYTSTPCKPKDTNL